MVLRTAVRKGLIVLMRVLLESGKMHENTIIAPGTRMNLLMYAAKKGQVSDQGPLSAGGSGSKRAGLHWSKGCGTQQQLTPQHGLQQ